ncbi:MAG: xanthine dehydrogenase family protein molybdopterin-binding subunit [Alphaproteobacteria bacterium]|jgi:aerobic carbon-monoxide dehydrogenase large subunit|nr:xanthine dehydrogenase family protein molybdopterin-binding subunit [Alphaproteobacteria bacterium]MBT4083879.1 xanthine dehydrogenase family protein molybdopterin-binding subunit [Alphaproteobacteria bacterium]MBT4546181.1 xanthine dehydrogenase family protein molybdopterin-binding subunit [Alphaproteobacteria bacterium]MBT7747605.1 xanthine dehydrogenase family protein molybdopterin-binding subunit [Alphaproteobacteria bacterium]
MSETGIGAAVRRKEDQRFLTGNGNYTDDINVFGQTYAAFVRSPHAHAKINGINTSAAAAADGVVAVLTGEELAADGVGPLICGWNIAGKNGVEAHNSPVHHALAMGKVNYVGDHVALVVAETQGQADSAAEMVEVDYEELPAVVGTGSALNHTTTIHEEAPANMCYDWEIGDSAATDAAFASAAHVTTVEVVNNRLIPNAMEPRACLAQYNQGTGDWTLHVTSQNPHVHRLVMSAFNGVAPEHKLRVIAPDVGGGFGSKIFIYAEEVVCTWATRKVGRPIKWTAKRSESFLSDAHGRDHVSKAELALDADGKFLALRVNTKANLGAYLSTFASAVPTYMYATLLAGTYTTPAIYCDVQGVFTNTAPVDAYRGAGRPEATYLLERTVETAAREMNIDPAEIRRRNFIQPDAFPYQTPVVHQYDIGDYGASLEKACEMADVGGFAARRSDSESRGKRRGLGYSSYIEACGIAPSAAVGALGGGVGLWESADIRFNATGSVTVMTGTHNHGQGHETAFAQVVSDKLGVPIENIEVVEGDTDKGPFGMGTYGSRSIAVGGSAIVKAADKIIEKGKKIAAHCLEAAEDDIEYDGGNFTVAGTDKVMNIAEIAFTAYVPHNYPEGVEPGLHEQAFYDPLNFSFPAGVHICEVEVDPTTGETEIVNYTAVDDFGTIINPMIVEGQVHGGIGQGVGQAMLEGANYDDNGQLVTGSYMDYTMPRADNLPNFNVGTTSTPSPLNPLGVKGAGEAGAIASPPAVINAITDACGGAMIDMPATQEKVWLACQAAE